MKTMISVSAFVLGVLLVGVGHATAVSVDSSKQQFGLQNYQSNGEDTLDPQEREQYRIINEENVKVGQIRPSEMECLTFVTCISNTSAVYKGKDEEGCPIFHCEKDSEKQIDIDEKEELKKLETKLAEVQEKIENLRRQAEELQNLIRQKKENRVIPHEQVCTKEYAPVCGEIDTGIRCVTTPCESTALRTFSNKCEATLNNAEVLYDGVCNLGTKETRTQPVFSERKKEIIINKTLPEKKIFLEEIPEKINVACTMEYAPVCAQASSSCPNGSDCISESRLRTYSNKCEAASHNATVVHEGVCKMEGTKEIRTEERHIETRDDVRIPIFPLDASALQEEASNVKKMPILRPTKWETILRYFSR